MSQKGPLFSNNTTIKLQAFCFDRERSWCLSNFCDRSGWRKSSTTSSGRWTWSPGCVQLGLSARKKALEDVAKWWQHRIEWWFSWYPHIFPWYPHYIPYVYIYICCLTPQFSWFNHIKPMVSTPGLGPGAQGPSAATEPPGRAKVCSMEAVQTARAAPASEAEGPGTNSLLLNMAIYGWFTW